MWCVRWEVRFFIYNHLAFVYKYLEINFIKCDWLVLFNIYEIEIELISKTDINKGWALFCIAFIEFHVSKSSSNNVHCSQNLLLLNPSPFEVINCIFCCNRTIIHFWYSVMATLLWRNLKSNLRYNPNQYFVSWASGSIYNCENFFFWFWCTFSLEFCWQNWHQ